MKKFLALILALGMLFSLAACGSSGGDSNADSDAPAATADAGSEGAAETEAAGADSGEAETLRVGTLDSTDTFDPTSNSDCGLGLMMVYDTVLKLNYDTMEAEPSIASSWEWIDDTTLKLTIRDDVTFSNGDQLTPQDVVYSLSRFVFENDQFDPGYDNIDFDNVVIEGNDVTLPLFEVDADFLLELANDRWASVLSETYVKENPDSFWDAPMGSGPYTCVENVDGSHSTYALREDYWGELPDAEEVIIQNYSEITTMIADFESGNLDIALDVSENDYLAAEGGDYGAGVTATKFKTWDVLAVCLPQYTEQFQDVRVRQAISLAMDTNAITNAVYGSLGTTADSILIEGSDFYSPIGVHEYDPDQAKALLAEAGYADGMELRLVIPSMPTNDKCAEIFQEYMRQVGITVNIESYDFATAIPILMADGTDISIFGTGGGTYTAQMVTSTLGEKSTNSGARVSDAGFNEPINTANGSLDETVRQENYTAAAQWAFDNYWTLPISYAEAVDISQANISGISGLTARSIDLTAVVIG